MKIHDWLLNAIRVDSNAVTLVTAKQVENGVFEPCEIRLTSLSPLSLHLYGQELKKVIQNGFVGKCRELENSEYFSLGQERDPDLNYIHEISPDNFVAFISTIDGPPIIVVSNDPIRFEKTWI